MILGLIIGLGVGLYAHDRLSPIVKTVGKVFSKL